MATPRVSKRDADMWELTISGWTQSQIAAKYGLTQPAVQQALAKIRAALPEKTKEELRAEIDGSYQKMMQQLADIAALKPRKLVDRETGEALPFEAGDFAGNVKALDSAAKVQEHRRRMLGLDDAVKIESTASVTFEVVNSNNDDLT